MSRYMIVFASYLIASLLFFLSPCFATERRIYEACIKYKQNYQWSHGYSVTGQVISGRDLNNAVGSYSRFSYYSDYFVVFWDNDEATIFQLPSLSMGRLPMFETEVEDQQGRIWKIKEGHFMCY